MNIPINPLMFLSAAAIGSISAFLAHKRGRNPYLWFALGFFFGIFGVFAIFFFGPKKKELPRNLKPLQPVFSIHGPRDKFWYYLDPAHEQKGPMSHDALTKAFREGKVSPSTYVWHEEMPEWKQLKETLRPIEQPQI